MRAKVEQESGCLFAYFNGACGDMTPVSRIEGEGRFTNAEYLQHGQTMADYTLAADGWQQVEAGPVQVKRLKLDIEVDHSLDHLEEIARPICAEWKATGDFAS